MKVNPQINIPFNRFLDGRTLFDLSLKEIIFRYLLRLVVFVSGTIIISSLYYAKMINFHTGLILSFGSVIGSLALIKSCLDLIYNERLKNYIMDDIDVLIESLSDISVNLPRMPDERRKEEARKCLLVAEKILKIGHKKDNAELMLIFRRYIVIFTIYALGIEAATKAINNIDMFITTISDDLKSQCDIKAEIARWDYTKFSIYYELNKIPFDDFMQKIEELITVFENLKLKKEMEIAIQMIKKLKKKRSFPLS